MNNHQKNLLKLLDFLHVKNENQMREHAAQIAFEITRFTSAGGSKPQDP